MPCRLPLRSPLLGFLLPVRLAIDAHDFCAVHEAIDAIATGATSEATKHISTIVFACDAGMGSSAMGASVLRNKIKKAGVDDVSVTNKAIANLDGSEDLVITQQQLTDRATAKSPDSLHVSVDNFMNSPKYDEVVEMVKEQRKDEE